MSDSATIFVTVNAVNDCPVATDGYITTYEDMVGSIDLATLVSDVDGDTLTYGVNPATNGYVTLTGSILTYMGYPDFYGSDSFTYTVEDSSGCWSTATISVTVDAINDAPVASDGYLTTDEDTIGSIDLVTLVNDVDSNLFSFTITQGMHGTVAVDVDGLATYMPEDDFFGTDEFTFTASDGHLSDSATIHVTVNPVNDAPVASDGYLTIAEDSSGYIDLSPLTSDIEGDPLTYVVGDSGNGESTLESLTYAKYVPDPDFEGTDEFTFTVSDGELYATATVYVTVSPVEDVPVAVDFYGHVLDDREYILDWTEQVSDPDEGDVLTILNITQPNNGVLADNGNGTISFLPIFGSSNVGVAYIVVSDIAGNVASFAATFNLLPAPVLDMVPIAGGSFDMGDHFDVGRPDELPVHNVILNDYQIDRFEVTNQQYMDYLNSSQTARTIRVEGLFVYQVGGAERPLATLYYGITYDGVDFSCAPGKENHPVVELSWYGAAHYANWLSAITGFSACYDEYTWDCNFSASGLRLPSEAEFEYASRGGEQAPYYQFPWASNFIATSDANYIDNGISTTVQVGSYAANSFGIFDMSGNVLEWCNDLYDSEYYAVSPQNNPRGPTFGSGRVVRGGSWFSVSADLRSARREPVPEYVRGTNLGLRLAISE
jgi:VCBS repeat-containing protein